MKLLDITGREMELETLSSMGKLTVFPGSFNPLHTGHKKIFELLTGKGLGVIFEISRSRFQKEPYSEQQIASLISQFKGYASLLVTDAPLFSQKQELLSRYDPYWVMGYDTAKRWIEENKKVDASQREKIRGMKVIFVGRLSEGVYYDPQHLLDGSERYNCSIFHLHCDISSTQIRDGRIPNA
jgi:Cytidylyltransferase-like